jgi:hypothetical protein
LAAVATVVAAAPALGDVVVVAVFVAVAAPPSRLCSLDLVSCGMGIRNVGMLQNVDVIYP